MNESIQISVSYNSKEILIELENYELDEDIFTKFIDQLSEKIGQKNILSNFKLMAINTNIPYLLVEENNFWNILHEERKDGILKLFMNKQEKNEEEKVDEGADELFFSGIKSSSSIGKDNDDDDDFNDEDFGQRDTFSEKKEEKISKEEENDLNNNNDSEKKEQKDDIDIKDNININNSNDINDNNLMLSENDKKNEKKELETKENEEKKNNIYLLEKVDDIEKDKEKNSMSKDIILKNIFIKESCTVCGQSLKNIKYICVICMNVLLCDSCEEKHNHPCLIYKTPFISSIKETYNFITNNYPSYSNLLTKKSQRNLSISLMADKNIYLRKNKGVLIPIKIMNNSNISVDSKDFIVLIKQNKLINISYNSNSYFQISPNSSYILTLKCITPDVLCKEDIIAEIFSNKFILKHNENLRINFSIEINEDNEEEDLNLKLCFNEMAILYNKEHKQIMVSLLENELAGNNIEDVLEVLLQYNWNKEEVLKYVSSLRGEK
jgi:hypothetical protein